MNRLEFQQLLNQERPATADCLPDHFAHEILAKGKLVRRLLRQHWKWLSISTFISLLIAIAFGFAAGNSSSDDPRPPLLLFQGSADTAPFSSE